MVVAGHASEQGALVIQVANKTTMDPKCSTILISFRRFPPFDVFTAYEGVGLQIPSRAPPVSPFFS